MRRRSRGATGPTRHLQLHRGAHTTCWLGRGHDGRLLVTKALHPDAGRPQRRRLAAQARRAVDAPSAAVLQPVDPWVGGDAPATVWPFVLGRDLGSRLRRHGPPEPSPAIELADGIDEAITSLHARGGVHGALTADHVLLDEGGRPLLIGLDPRRPAGDATRREDRRAAAALRAALVDGDEEALGRRQGADLALPGPPARRLRLPVPVAVGVAVTLAGAAVAQAGRGHGADACPDIEATAGPTADVDGDGCTDRLDWSSADGLLTATTRGSVLMWELGRPGDQLLVHDWDCDGIETPGLHRPSTGRTYAFDGWPTDGSVEAVENDPPRPCIDLPGGVDP